MQFILRSYGRVEVELIPETPIESAFVTAFLAAAAKGQPAQLEPVPESSALIVSVGR